VQREGRFVEQILTTYKEPATQKVKKQEGEEGEEELLKEKK
jgi:hypothetical protein